MREARPEVVAIGEETVSSEEGLRLAGLAKEIRSDCVVIAGGCHYPWALEHTFGTGTVDYVVCSEGEETLTELVGVIKDGGDPGRVKGIIRRKGAGWERTEARELIEDLDELPMPAYDLLEMERYGRRSVNHPRLAAVEHGRGCVDSCRFCILWKQMGRVRKENGRAQVTPCYRTKSAKRSAEEVEWLVKRFGRKTMTWVDGTWNADPEWSEEFCERVTRAGLKVQMTAWMRADAVVRDESRGVLAKQVRAGLVQAMIGVERTSSEEVERLGKHGSTKETTREAFRALRRYPSVYTIGTVIYGVTEETRARLAETLRETYDYEMDYTMLVPFTPNPGTDYWEEPGVQERLRRKDWRLFNFHTPVMDSEGMTVEELERFYLQVGMEMSWRRWAKTVSRMFGSPARRRTVHRALMGHACEVFGRAMAGGRNGGSGLYAVKPGWYED